jgi:hypothetical protein
MAISFRPRPIAAKARRAPPLKVGRHCAHEKTRRVTTNVPNDEFPCTISQITGIGGGSESFKGSLTGFSGETFDQGKVDGKGHIFIASNSGDFMFMDYTASGSITDASTFKSLQFLAGSLDDVAPLVGLGSNPTSTTPKPSTIVVWTLLGLISLMSHRWWWCQGRVV